MAKHALRLTLKLTHSVHVRARAYRRGWSVLHEAVFAVAARDARGA